MCADLPPSAAPTASAVSRPLVVSLCGTFLKPEMQSIYRQVTGLRRFQTVVFTEQIDRPDLFPFEPVVVMQKLLVWLNESPVCLASQETQMHEIPPFMSNRP